MNIIPVGNRVVVEKIENHIENKNGIIIIDNASRKEYIIGKVLRSDSKNFNIDDKIIFLEKNSVVITENNQEIFIVEEENILAIIK